MFNHQIFVELLLVILAAIRKLLGVVGAAFSQDYVVPAAQTPALKYCTIIVTY